MTNFHMLHCSFGKSMGLLGLKLKLNEYSTKQGWSRLFDGLGLALIICID